MPKLPDSFPGFAALEAAGEATHAKVRKRIADKSLTQIEGIGAATAEKIEAAFEEIDSPAIQAEEMKASEDDSTKPSDHLDNAINKPDLGDAGGQVVNDGTISDETVRKSREEADKTGAEKNAELPNHALDQPTGAEAQHNRVLANDGQRLALSGAVFVDDPKGAYASKTAVPISQNDGRIKVVALGTTSPRKGMEVRDGDDVYALGDEYRPDSNPSDWLKVRSPTTGKPLID